MTVNQGLKKLGKKDLKSIVSEVIQMHNKGVFEGVFVQDLKYKDRKRIITSSMFLKEKFQADGKFDKVKARLVAGGHQ
jgi:hypothetical protein